jgi:hypothetical protein
MAARKGTRPPNAGKGRVTGSLNRSTKTLKEAIAHVLEHSQDECLGWLQAVAEGEREFEPELDDNGDPVLGNDGEPKGEWNWLRRPEPAAAFKLWQDLAEFAAPKLARTEHTGENGGAIKVQGSIEFVSPIPRSVP